MREILYRGKNAGGDGWIYGVPLDDEIIRNVDGFVVGMKIKPETVCEFTGLTDKNGVKIFEGDIVKCEMWNHGDQIGVITYEPAQYIVDTGNLNTEYLFNCENIEVIGNIFDNPELMGGEKNA